MAKCVKNKQTSEIVRVSDSKASNLVNSGLWQYCAKQEYKSFVRSQERLQSENKTN